MKKACVQILIILATTPGLLFGQQLTKNEQTKKGITFGIKTSLYLSHISPYKNIRESGYLMVGEYYCRYDNKHLLKAGTNLGLFFDFHLKDHFYLQTELDYIFTKNEISYGGFVFRGATDYFLNADYILTCSMLRFCIFPGFLMGKNNRIHLFACPYFQFPVYTKNKGTVEQSSYNDIKRVGTRNNIYDDEIQDIVKPGLGLDLGIKFELPSKKNVLGLEIRFGMVRIAKEPKLRESSISIGLIFKGKIKQNNPDLVNKK